MKKLFSILIFIIFTNQQLFAVTLSEALLQAYKNNPELNAERENIGVSKQDLKISNSEFLPTLTISGTKSQENTNKLTNQAGNDVSTTDTDPVTQTLKIEQNIYQGFGGIAKREKSKINLDMAQAKLKKKRTRNFFKSYQSLFRINTSKSKTKNQSKQFKFIRKTS